MAGFDDLVVKIEGEGETKKENVDKPTNHIAFVMDHSGSMSMIAEQSRLNFNEQLQQIKKDSKEQDNYVTIIEFDGNVKEVCSNKDINEVNELEKYWVGGMTALYDAIALAIGRIENNIPKEGNHAALVVIITDGQENDSKEHKGEKGRLVLKGRIEELQKTDKWTFVFMGANQDVLETAVEGIGICVGNTLVYKASGDGVRDSGVKYNTAYDTWSSSRSSGSTYTTSFFDKDKEIRDMVK